MGGAAVTEGRWNQVRPLLVGLLAGGQCHLSADRSTAGVLAGGGVDWGHGCLRWLAALLLAQLDARLLSSLAVVLREMLSLTRSPVAFLKGA